MKKLKLNLGCGSDYKKGWTNVDNYAEYKTDKQLDLDVLPYPWKTNTVDYIYMDNVLEHLEEPVKVLRECARILKPGGTLEVIVPDGLSPSACGLDHKYFFTLSNFVSACEKRTYFCSLSLDIIKTRLDLEFLFLRFSIHNKRLIRFFEGNLWWLFPLRELTIWFQKRRGTT